MVERTDKKRKLSEREQEVQEPVGVKRDREGEAQNAGDWGAPAKRRAPGEEDAADEDMEAGMVDRWEYMQVACEGEEFEHEEWADASQGEWCEEFMDSRTGEILDPEKVREARREEIGELERRVYMMVDVDECWAKTGKGPIDATCRRMGYTEAD